MKKICYCFFLCWSFRFWVLGNCSVIEAAAPPGEHSCIGNPGIDSSNHLWQEIVKSSTTCFKMQVTLYYKNPCIFVLLVRSFSFSLLLSLLYSFFFLLHLYLYLLSLAVVALGNLNILVTGDWLTGVVLHSPTSANLGPAIDRYIMVYSAIVP